MGTSRTEFSRWISEEYVFRSADPIALMWDAWQARGSRCERRQSSRKVRTFSHLTHEELMRYAEPITELEKEFSSRWERMVESAEQATRDTEDQIQLLESEIEDLESEIEDLESEIGRLKELAEGAP